MTTTPEFSVAPEVLNDHDSLFQLQLRIARRADEVARESGDSNAPRLFAWIQAEREVFSGLEM